MRFELWSLPAMLLVLSHLDCTTASAASRAPAPVNAVDSVAMTVSDVDRAVDFYSRVDPDGHASLIVGDPALADAGRAH